jgi:hypothetical protein
MVPVEMLGGNAFPPIGQLNFLLTLAPYGFYWFALAAENQMPSWHVEPAQSLPDFTTLVLKKRMEELLEAPTRNTLEQTSCRAGCRTAAGSPARTRPSSRSIWPTACVLAMPASGAAQ